MPIFEYKCTDCGREFEAFVTGERTAACPACRGANLAKLLSSPGMVGASAGPTRGRSEPADFPSNGACGAGTCGCKN
jgi:putative FmdB family regulatory protein